MDFANLHQHSHYSLRDGIAKVSDIVNKAVSLGYPGVGLTDHGTMAATLELYNLAKEKGIKPIMGTEIYVATRSRRQKEHGIDKYYHLTLLAMNDVGWRNLVRLVSEGYKDENLYYKPRIDRELLRQYNEGLICLSGCIGGNLSNAIMRAKAIKFTDEEGNSTAECAHCEHDHDELNVLNESYMDVLNWHKDVFGDRFYLEVQNHNMEVEQAVTETLFDLADKTGIKPVATGDAHFIDAEDEKAHDIMLAIRGNMTIHDEKMGIVKYPGKGYHMQSYDEMCVRFPGRKDAVENTIEIVERCNVNFNLGNFRIPKLVDVYKEDDILREQTYAGLNKRFPGGIPKEIINRTEEELTTISQMTFPNYFLMVSDYVRWAKSNGIPVGPGRGSAAGSIVSYALDITDVNPLDYDLSFSRFLNKGRCSLPLVDFKEYPLSEWRTHKH